MVEKFQNFFHFRELKNRIIRTPRARMVEFGVLAAIIGLAAILRFTNLSVIGYGNQYYTAAIKSMLQSWHNFFFLAAEPGGSVSIDKPPVGFWLQAISALIFGVNGFSVVLPQIIAGILSVGVVYHLVRRSYGPVAGSLAALILAITPIVVATDRNNTIDSTLILVLLLAAWAFIKATETGKLKYLILGAGLVGIGFNIKMLEAYLPLPAFYAFYFLGSTDRIWLKVKKLFLATIILVVISLSWAVVVDLTPASERPYVGSSGDNSELSLIFGYNGIQRLVGMGRGQGNSPIGNQPDGMNSQRNFGSAPSSGSNLDSNPGMNGDNLPQSGDLPSGNYAGDRGSRDAGNNPMNGGNGNFTGDGGNGMTNNGMNVGNPGILRLFIQPLNKEMSWLLPFGLISIGFITLKSKSRWPISPNHQSIILWGGWLITGVIFFSVAGFFHQYYLSTLAPALAAISSIGVVELWKYREKKPWLAYGVIVISVWVTIAFQIFTASTYLSNPGWIPYVLGLGGLGTILLTMGALRKTKQLTAVGTVCLVAAMLVTPGIWSGLTTLSDRVSVGIPSSYDGGSLGSTSQSNITVNETILNFLEANTQGMKYLVAVESAGEGEGYVLATGRPVLYMGGFNGQDQVVASEDLAKMVAEGSLRYILGAGNGTGGQSSLSTWITSNCTAISDLGSMGALSGNSGQAGRGTQTSLYDCKPNG
jgi:4-amino-4-deoxy-L-arabinose transferase-like glycosyltransferase